jgi:uncharacterized membrane protein YecN with MAPEG domain
VNYQVKFLPKLHFHISQKIKLQIPSPIRHYIPENELKVILLIIHQYNNNNYTVLHIIGNIVSFGSVMRYNVDWLVNLML